MKINNRGSYYFLLNFIITFFNQCFYIHNYSQMITSNNLISKDYHIIDTNSTSNPVFVAYSNKFYNKLKINKLEKKIDFINSILKMKLSPSKISKNLRFYNNYLKSNSKHNVTNLFINQNKLNTTAVIENKILENTRNIKFLISESNNCSVFITDYIKFNTYNNKLENSFFKQHSLLHNNVEYIEPINVYSNNTDIQVYSYNRNTYNFDVYYDKNVNQNKTSSITFDYIANNLIKYFNEKDQIKKSVFSFNKHDKNNNESNYNYFIWKILNPSNNKKLNMNIEIYFDIKDAKNYNVSTYFNLKNKTYKYIESNLKFKSDLVYKDDIINNTYNYLNKLSNNEILKLYWKGTLSPEQVLVINTKFSTIFTTCKKLNINITHIIVGSFFLMFAISIIYILISSIFFKEY